VSAITVAGSGTENILIVGKNMLRLRMPERNYIFISFIFEGIGK
jgi:hypothetical protein